MTNTKKFMLLILGLSLLCLGGCSYVARPALKYRSWRERQLALQQISNWTIAGAVSIAYHNKRDIARFHWTHNPTGYVINIFGPFNMNNALIEGDAKGVKFWQKKKCISAPTPEQLVLTQLGWHLPISYIQYWIFGMPVPTAKIEAINLDQDGQLIAFKQRGWHIKFAEFQANATQVFALPRVIELANQEIAIKIKITQQVLGIPRH